jgi:hypothetical protein
MVSKPSGTNRGTVRLDRQDRYRGNRSEGAVVVASGSRFGCDSGGRLARGQAMDRLDAGRYRGE